MKIKAAILITSQKSINELIKIKMKILGALALKEAINKINEALKPVNELREKIITDKVEKDEKGEIIRPNGNKDLVQLTLEGQQELNELLNAEIEVPLEKINVAIFGDIMIETTTVMDLDWLLSV